ncbi:MAG: TIGR00645 family protein [Alphaproteobacteria bacterium]|nr:TIGR00645 family protein [Alphaproteobacteria bacterium]MCA0448577.1 TIGR00645 family protein [Pseudomonadota bacterium]
MPLERFIERLIFASRWLQAPLYVGLIVVMALLAAKFFQELVHLTAILWTLNEYRLVLAVLGLVDMVMVANLIVMVVISGYENFVSRLELDGVKDRLSWFGKLDAGSLKIKLASSIVAISSIHLLKAFLDVNEIPTEKLILLVVIHLTFIVSALMLAYLDKMLGQKNAQKDEA